MYFITGCENIPFLFSVSLNLAELPTDWEGADPTDVVTRAFLPALQADTVGLVAGTNHYK